MQFRDLKTQYTSLKEAIDARVLSVMENAQYINGPEVHELEEQLAAYVGVRHCISCGNGTDALRLVLEGFGMGPSDAVFVPDFTFFASAEVIATVGATPVFVDVDPLSYNISVDSLKKALERVRKEGTHRPRMVIAVDLFGLPADYEALEAFCKEEDLLLLEDGAQGFSGAIGARRAGSFGDAATTSFFPAKPLGCYGDGGAIFTNSDELAARIQSLAVHGKGKEKYDNVRIGHNSRLDTLQAAVLLEKFKALVAHELQDSQDAAAFYNEALADVVQIPVIQEGYTSAYAQYTIQLPDGATRDRVMAHLKAKNIPTMVYYPKGMHQQTAFAQVPTVENDVLVSRDLCSRVLSLPFSPYITRADQELVIAALKEALHETK
ncbi:DegT/DnrJ/EryC1/StrS family protein [Clostridiaceae bacterium JG1575]|nr:DegT/DnrJ/EryC1/StrS family protein [Clostridiaceae bacterium JG1575]